MPSVPVPDGYVRKCKPLQFSFDHDAVAMLYELVPTKKAVGRYLSELIRRDYLRRQEWSRLQDLQQAALAEVGDD